MKNKNIQLGLFGGYIISPEKKSRIRRHNNQKAAKLQIK